MLAASNDERLMADASKFETPAVSSASVVRPMLPPRIERTRLHSAGASRDHVEVETHIVARIQ
jgi:hypothetical protein